MKKEKAKCRLSCLALIIIDYSVEGASEYLASHLFYTHTPGERGLKGPSRCFWFGCTPKKKDLYRSQGKQSSFFGGENGGPLT